MAWNAVGADNGTIEVLIGNLKYHCAGGWLKGEGKVECSPDVGAIANIKIRDYLKRGG